MEKLSRIEEAVVNQDILGSSRIEEILKEKLGMDYISVPRISRIEKLLNDISFGSSVTGASIMSYTFFSSGKGSSGVMEVKT